MGSIERFMERLRQTREVMGKRFSSKKGQKEIADALEEIEEVEKTLDWMPKSGHPGTGTTSESTKRMSRGGLP